MPYWNALSWSGMAAFFGTRVENSQMANDLRDNLPTVVTVADLNGRYTVVAGVNLDRIPSGMPPRFAAILGQAGIDAFEALYPLSRWGYVTSSALSALRTEWTNGGPLASTSNQLPGAAIDDYT